MKRRAFTLIELLIVIAVTSILTGILIPVVARARENGRRDSCRSNLKQIGMALIQYTQDYDDLYPRIGAHGSQQWVLPVMPYLKNELVFCCPSDELVGAKPAGEAMLSYALNTNVAYDWEYYDRERVSTPFVAEFNAPARTVMVMEIRDQTISFSDSRQVQKFTSTNNGCKWPHQIHRAGTGYIDNNGTMNAPGQTFWDGYAQHQEGANYLACDGHVKWLKAAAVSGGNNQRRRLGSDSCPQMAEGAPVSHPGCTGYGVITAEGTHYAGSDKHAMTFNII